MVDWLFRLEVLREERDKLWHEVVRDLITEHVDKLDASRFENGQIVNGNTLLNLKLGDNQLRDVTLQKLCRDASICCTVLISIAANACRNDQVDHSRHLLPLAFLILRILLLQRLDQFTNQLANLIFEVA